MAAGAVAFTNPVTAGIAIGGTVLKIGIAELVAHSARVKAAKSENAGIPQVVAAFDSDVAAIVSAYNNGQASAADCITACQTVDANIQAALKSNVGASGTSWNTASGLAGKCDKSCTAGCCVYYGALGPVLSLMQVALGGAGGSWGRSDHRLTLTATGGTIQVPEVFKSKYGGEDRPGYTITLSRPPALGAVQSGILSTIDELLGKQPDSLQGLLPSGTTASGVNPMFLIIGVVFVFGAILIAAMMGRS